MSVQLRLKNLTENLPEFDGRPLANVPFVLRLSSACQKMQKECTNLKSINLASINYRGAVLFLWRGAIRCSNTIKQNHGAPHYLLLKITKI